MSQEYEYFYEDEVFRFNKKGQLQLGMVLENAELVSSDEESDVEEEDKVTKGNIRVAWYPIGEEVVLSERKVHLADRSLMPGDVVRRLIKGRDTQRGYCRQVRVMARVQLVIGGKHVLPCVDSINLTPLEDFATDMAISLDSWVGMIHMIKCRLLLHTKDGSSCLMPDHAAEELTDTRDSRDKECEFRRYDFYPGQCLQGTVKHFEEAEWLHVSPLLQAKLDATEPAKHGHKIRATVIKVEVQQLGVRWLCRAFSPDLKGEATPPKYLVMGDALKRVRILNVFEPCTLQLGDRNYYTIRQGDSLISRKEWEALKACYSKASPSFIDFLNIPNVGETANESESSLRRNGFNIDAVGYLDQSKTIAINPVARVSEDTNGCDGTTVPRETTALTNGICHAATVESLVRSPNDTSALSIDSSTSSATPAPSTTINSSNSALNPTTSTGPSTIVNTSGSTSNTTTTAPAPSALTSAASAIAAALSSLTSTALTSVTSKKSVTHNGLAEEGGLYDTEDEDDNYVDVDGVSGDEAGEEEDDAASVSSSTSTSSFGGTGHKRSSKGGPALMTRMMKRKKLRSARRPPTAAPHDPCASVLPPKEGDRVVVETLMTTSYADVVWQDGSVEFGIPSSQLYPIHHLDDQEFFPGDFVVEQKPPAVGLGVGVDDVDPHEYGVVQRVDHAGRTTIVKWFRTYTAGAEPQPILKGEQEVSVYDLRDHPDFRYRPGSVVIRVANFDNDQTCSTGQVLDNYPTGQVNVWWVDGSSSVCFPQDLYKVGEYDSDDGELWDDGDESISSDSDDDDRSWQTASGDEEGRGECNSGVLSGDDGESLLSVGSDAPQQLKTRLVANIEKARIAMSRLEEIFTQNPGLQSTQVMRQLLDCYKECRYMDKLMSTRFFHESNFAGLVEKVRERGRASSNQKMAEQFNRLFSIASGASSPGHITKTAGKEVDSSVLKTTKLDKNLPSACEKTVVEDSSTNLCFPEDSLDDRNEISSKDNRKEQQSTNCPEEHLQSSDSDKVFVDKGNGSFTSSKKIVDKNAKEVTSRDSGIQLSEEPSLPPPPFLQHQHQQLPQCKSSAKNSLKPSSISGTGLHKRLSESDMVANHHNTLESKGKRPSASSHIKDSKSCSDIKNSVSSRNNSSRSSDSASEATPVSCKELKLGPGVGEDMADISACSGDAGAEGAGGNSRYTSSMCAVLCSMMKAQLLKTYEEVVSRYGGHFDMSNIQATQKSDGDLEPKNLDGDEDDIENIFQVPLVVSGDVDVQLSAMDAADAAITKISDKILNDVLRAASATPPAPPESSPPASPTEEKVRSGGDAHEKVLFKTGAPASVARPFEADCGSFMVLDSAPDSHKFKLTMLQPSHPGHFYKTVRNEMRLLQTSLPAGIWVRGYQDRMDLYSVMIRGPAKTPYQDGLFLFDFQLSADYPHAPPLCNYITYCSDRLNPNLYEDGKVCVSLLGTWSGKGTEVWTHKSNLLQVIISIQGLILVSEPYFNEAGYERQKGSQQGHENSRMYNEMVLLKLIQATARMLQQPPSVFKDEIFDHFNANGCGMISRLERWLQISERHNSAHPLSPTTPNTYRSFVADPEQQSVLPEFPLIPASKGFCLTLRSTLPQVCGVFDQILEHGWDAGREMPSPSVTAVCSVREKNVRLEASKRCVGTNSYVDVSHEGSDSGFVSSSIAESSDNTSGNSCSSGASSGLGGADDTVSLTINSNDGSHSNVLTDERCQVQTTKNESDSSKTS